MFVSLLSETQSCSSHVQCLKVVVSCILPNFTSFYSGRANLVPITPLRLEAEMSFQFGKYKFLEKILKLLWLICILKRHFRHINDCFFLIYFCIHLLGTAWSVHKHLEAEAHPNSLSPTPFSLLDFFFEFFIDPHFLLQ